MAARRSTSKAAAADPSTQLAELAAELERAPRLRAGYVLSGEERYFRDRAWDLLKARAAEVGLEVCAHDATDPDFALQNLLADLSSGSLFSTGRCVGMRNVEKLLQKDEKEHSALTRAIVSFIGKGDGAAGCVVLSCSSLAVTHLVSKTVAEAGGWRLNARKLWDTPPPWGGDPRATELVQWLLARARERRVPLDPNEALYLAAAIGNDLAALDGQLSQLGSGKRRNVRETVDWRSGASPFTVAESIAGGDAPRALSGLEALFAGGFQDKGGTNLRDPMALIPILTGSVLRLVRQGWAFASACADGASEDEAATLAGVAAGRFRDRTLALLARRDARAWMEMMEDLATLDRRFKTGGHVDVNDYFALALRWKLAARPKARKA